MNNPQSFPGRMLLPLDELAHQLLQLKQYDRLQVITELLAVFTHGSWDNIDKEAKQLLVEKLEQSFNIKAWDDLDWKDRNAYSQICNLIDTEKKALSSK